MDNSKRIEANGSYLILAPKSSPEFGYYHSISEHAYLVDNLIAFLQRHTDIDKNQITVYELREVNERV